MSENQKRLPDKSGFIKQASILTAAGLLSRFLGFLYRLPLTKLIGDEGNSIYAAGYNIYNFLLILSSAGIPVAVSKMVSERLEKKEYVNAHQVFKASLIFTGALGTIFMVVLLVFAVPIANSVDSPESVYCLRTLAPTVLIVAIMSCFRGYFQGMNKMMPTAVSQIVEQIFNAIFSVVLAYVFVKQSVALGAAGGTAGTGIGAAAGLAMMVFIYKLVEKDLEKRRIYRSYEEFFESKREVLIKLIKIAFPIIAGTAVFSITNLIDTKMVLSLLKTAAHFTEEQANVLYGQLSGKYVVLSTLPVSISTAVATAAVPNIAAAIVNGEKRLIRKKINLALKVSMVVSIPAAIGMAVLSSQILQLLFPAYPDGGELIKLGAASIIFLALSQINTGILQGIGKVKLPVLSAVVGAILKIAFNFILIGRPSINVKGAIISTTICYAVASIMNLYFVIRETGVRPNLNAGIFRPAIASAIMGVVCWVSYKGLFAASGRNSVSTIGAILISIAVYAILVVLMRIMNEEEILTLPKGAKINRLLKRLRLV